MARELQVVPKKIQYVAIQEQHLYDEEETPSPASNIRVENEDMSMFSLSHATRSLCSARSDATNCTNNTNVSIKNATLDVQRT
ncbi:Dual serine/threonine and tyrosine protein kinase, partial [Operophtera brumata]